MSRRYHVLVVVGLLLLPAGVHAVSSTQPTGPKSPGWDLALTPPGEPGAPFVIEGRVMGGDGSQPLRDVLVHVYHADARGDYSGPGESRPRLSGMLRTNVLGRFRVRTVLPGKAEGIPHVHFEVAGPVSDYRVVALNLCRRNGAGSDSTFARLPQMLTLPTDGNWVYVHRDPHGVFVCRWDLPFSRAARVRGRPEAFARPSR